MTRHWIFLGGLFLTACEQAAVTPDPGNGLSNPMVGQGQQALSMGNGPGMGMNGPGMGMNGPGMGMNGVAVGAGLGSSKLGVLGMAYVSPVGATLTYVGTPLASVTLVKGELRGIINTSPKTRLTGTGFTGVTLVARGLTDQGATATTTRSVRVVAAEAAPAGVALQDTDFYHYRIQVYHPAQNAWIDPCDGGYAIALPGRFSYWDGGNGAAPAGTLAGGTYDPNPVVFSFACQRTAVQKCAEGTHYKPWQTVRGPVTGCSAASDPSNCSAWTLGGAEALQTCVRLVRGDFCGDGHALTFDGTLIDGLDNYPSDGIEPDEPDHPDWPVEALWTKDGALCMDQTRVTGEIDAYLTRPENTIKCQAARQPCSQAEMDKFSNLTAPRMLNRSMRKMAIYRPSAPKSWGQYGQSSAAYTDDARGLVIAAIGAPATYGTYGVGEAGRGAVHVYRILTGATVAGQRELVATLPAPPESTIGALFGAVLTLRAVPGAEGPDLYVGAPLHSSEAGAVYRYPFTGWTGNVPSFGAPVAVPNPAGGRFGMALAASPSGRLFIGAPQAPCSGNKRGVVYVAEPGSQTLTPVDNPNCSAGPQHGQTLLAPTESELLVGSLYENARPDCSALVNTSGLGAVRLYNRQPSGAYSEAWKLGMPECSTRGYPNFGINIVRITDKLLISAEAAGFVSSGVDQSAAGRVYVYSYSTTSAPQHQVTLSSPSPGTNRQFGIGLAAYQAGDSIVAIGEYPGKVHFFKLQDNADATVSTTLVKTLQDPLFIGNTQTGFGLHLRSAGPLLLLGAPNGSDDSLNYSGGLYHFITSTSQPTP